MGKGFGDVMKTCPICGYEEILCEVSGCENEAEYEGWYRCTDPLLDTPTGLIQRRMVCIEHTTLLIGAEKEKENEL